MKNINKYLNILNLVVILIFMLLGFIFKFMYLYKPYITILRILFYAELGLNIICGIANLIKHNKLFGILSMIIGIIPFAILPIKYTDLQYDLPDSTIGIIIFAICIIVAILSIINLIINRNIIDSERKKLPLILAFVIFILINIITICLAFIKHSNNVNNFEKALSLMENEKNIQTYILSQFNSTNKEYIFIDNNGNEIAKKQYDNITSFNRNFTVNNNPVSLAYAKTDNKNMFINSIGEEIFSINEDIDDFTQYIIGTGKYNFKRMSSNSYNEATNNNIIEINYNTLERYQEKNKAFEDNNSYKYMYFKNSDFFNNVVLQVTIKHEKENDNELLNMYEEFCDYEVDIDDMSNYYNYKKDFYLLNFENNSKIKLECNNLIYEAIYGTADEKIENIILFSNGNIPFYDKTEIGYFDKEGAKTLLNTPYTIYDVTDKYIFVNEKSTGKTYILSSQTGETIKVFANTLIKYEGFYISYPNEKDGTYELIDKDLNVLVTADYAPEFIGKSLINIADLDYNSYIYFYNNGNIKKLYYSDNYLYNVISSQEQAIISSNIYSNIGILEIE